MTKIAALSRRGLVKPGRVLWAVVRDGRLVGLDVSPDHEPGVHQSGSADGRSAHMAGLECRLVRRHYGWALAEEDHTAVLAAALARMAQEDAR